jgi:hypothetical protein
MTIKSKPYFWIVCDAEGCNAEYPGDASGEYSALNSLEAAIDGAEECDWWITATSKSFCEDHANWHCHTCGDPLTVDEQVYGNYECEKCEESND